MTWKKRFETGKGEFLVYTSRRFVGNEDMLKLCKRRGRELNRHQNEEAILHCISRFVDAEFDFESRGDRGIGRLSTIVPRYGAYFRKFLRRLAQHELDLLRQRTTSQLVFGYMCHTLFEEPTIWRPTTPGSEALFKDWIPIIYSSSLPASFSENALEALGSLSEPSTIEHRNDLQRLGIRGGGLFRPDRTEIILAFYPLAGFGLRAMETRRAQTAA